MGYIYIYVCIYVYIYIYIYIYIYKVDILLNINRGHCTVALFVDMKKAFDTVDHKILMCKLNRLGLHRDTVDWFSSYLSNRIQTTFVNGKCSNRADVTYGVP